MKPSVPYIKHTSTKYLSRLTNGRVIASAPISILNIDTNFVQSLFSFAIPATKKPIAYILLNTAFNMPATANSPF